MTLVPRGLVTTDALVSTTSDVVAVAVVVVVVDYDGARARKRVPGHPCGRRVACKLSCSGVLEWRTGYRDLEVVIV